MSREGKTFPNEAAARGALNAAHATWVPLPRVNVGGGIHADHALLPPQKLAEPFRLANGKWAVVADHPGFKGEMIDDADLPPYFPPEAQQSVAPQAAPQAPKGKTK